MIRIARSKRVKNLLIFVVAFVFLFSIVLILSQITTRNNSHELILRMVHQSSREIVQPESITVIQGPSKVKGCQNAGSPHFMLFMFITSPQNRERRRVIRKVLKERLSWWENLIVNKHPQYEVGSTIRALFFVGRTVAGSEVTVLDLIQEGKEHGDMILDNFYESYFNLTLKTLRMLKWVEANCGKVPYLVKIDDDVYLNVPEVLSFLFQNLESQDLIAGNKYSNLEIISDTSSKWFTPNSVWGSSHFPDFVSGIFYILGARARSKLYEGALNRSLFHLEDVFLTGIVREEAELGLKVDNIPSIWVWWTIWQKLFYNCSTLKNVMAIHPLSANELLCYNQVDKVCRPNSFMPLYIWC